MLHHVNDASFALPEQLTDRTMHVFVSRDDEAGDFSVVMSHAKVQPEETLADFADDIVTGMSQAMPDFSLLASTERSLAGMPAIELAYVWQRRFKWLHQRQVLLLVPGIHHRERESLLITATCQKQFAHQWHATFENLLGSLKLRERIDTSNNVATVAVKPAIKAPTVFGLCASRRAFHAFANQDEACSNTDSYEVQADAWRFFDAVGNPLRARFEKPSAWWREPGKYVLEPPQEHGMPSLRNQLHLAENFVCHASAVGLSSIAEVRTMLDQLAKE